MGDQGLSEKGINWAGWHIEYRDLHNVFFGAAAGFAQL